MLIFDTCSLLLVSYSPWIFFLVTLWNRLPQTRCCLQQHPCTGIIFLNLCVKIRDPPLPCTLVLGWALCQFWCLFFFFFFPCQSSVLSSSPSLNFGLGHNHTTAIIRRSCQLLAGSGLSAGRTLRQLSFPAPVIIYQVKWTIISQKFVTQPTLAALNGYPAWHKDHFATNTKSFFQNILQWGI